MVRGFGGGEGSGSGFREGGERSGLELGVVRNTLETVDTFPKCTCNRTDIQAQRL